MYGLSEKTLEEAKLKYRNKIKDEFVKKGVDTFHAVSNSFKETKDFFEVCTPENKKWLMDNGYLEPDDQIQIPMSVLKDILKKVEKAEKMVKELKEEVKKYKASD